jgi:hypothetical protein
MAHGAELARVAREELKRGQPEEKREPTLEEMAVLADEILEKRTPGADMDATLEISGGFMGANENPRSYIGLLVNTPDEIAPEDQTYYRAIAVAFLQLKAKLEREQHPEV